MVDGGLPAPQPPPADPALPVVAPAPPTQSPAPPTPAAVPPIQPAAPPVQPGLMSQLNWSHFKLEFAGKLDEDAEPHLLRTNDWMDTHAFPEDVKVQRFCNFSRRSYIMV